MNPNWAFATFMEIRDTPIYKVKRDCFEKMLDAVEELEEGLWLLLRRPVRI